MIDSIDYTSNYMSENSDKEEDKGGSSGNYLKDLMEKQRTLFISEEVSPKLTRKIVPALLWLDSQNDDPIRLFINTPGGSADDGFAIYDAIKFIRSPVLCITNGLNASAGTVILLATPNERRFSLPNSRIMIHQPSSGDRGKAAELENTAHEMLKARGSTNELIASETGRDVEQVEKDTNKDYWMSPEEACEYGLIGQILTSLNDL